MIHEDYLMESKAFPQRKSYHPPLGRSKVARSRWKDEIELRFSRGESAEAISRWLKTEDECVSARALRSYRQFVLTPKMLMEQTDYALAHPYLKERLDALDKLYDAIAIQENRLGLGLKKEAESGVLSSMVGANMKVLLDLLTTTLDAEISLGLRVKQVPNNDNDILKRLINGVLKKTDNPE